MNRRLLLFRWSWAAFMVAATSVPYLINRSATPANHYYTWAPPTDPQDFFGYMAWAQQAAHGAWLLKIKYTALPHAGFLFHPFFLICGWLSALFSCDPGPIFWCLKAAGVVCFFVALYRYLDFLELRPLAWIASTILISIGGGFGGTLIFLGANPQAPTFPADGWMPEVVIFWALLRNPLFPFSLTLLLLSIFWLDRGTRQLRSTDFWLSGVASGVLALIHPYSLPLLFGFAVAITVLGNRATVIPNLLRYFGPVMPFVIYLAALRYFQPLVTKHSSQGVMRSPPVIAYLSGFGLPLLLAAFGLLLDWPRMATRYWQLVLWFVLSIWFAYLPFWFQRKLIFGAQIPVCILAGLTLDSIFHRVSLKPVAKWVRGAVLVLLLPLVAATPIYFFTRESRDVPGNGESGSFISKDVMDGLRFLKKTTRPDDVVFASTSTSRFIPAFSGNTAVWGHWAMSVDFDDRQKWVANVFNRDSDWTDERRVREFWNNDIKFVFLDGESKQWMETNPFLTSLLFREAEKVFENGSVSIYRRPRSLDQEPGGPEKQ